MAITNIKELGKLPLPNGDMLVVDLDDVNGVVMVSLRQWYRDANDAWQPGRKGIAMRPEQWDAVRKFAPAKADIPERQQVSSNGTGRKL